MCLFCRGLLRPLLSDSSIYQKPSRALTYPGMQLRQPSRYKYSSWQCYPPIKEQIVSILEDHAHHANKVVAIYSSDLNFPAAR